MTTDPGVLVVGAGPAGLTLAIELARRRIGLRIIDAVVEPPVHSRAPALQTPTVEVLGRLDSPFPHTLVLEHLAGLGVVVERGVELLSLTRMPGGVAVELRHRDTREQVRPTWLAGCDGAHSTVRHLLGLPFDGASYPDEFLIGDMDVDWPLARDEGHGFLAESFRSRVRALAPVGTTLRDPVRLGSFHVHRRLVSQMRSGRVFLVGDAAHIHSPAGELGLNDAIQDAANLGWKLALVTTGAAPTALLDTYHAERHPLASATLRGTDLATRAVTSSNPVRRLLPRLLGFAPLQRRLVPLVGQLKTTYPPSPFVEDGPWHGNGIAAGHRAPDAPLSAGPSGSERLFDLFGDTRHVLLLFEGLASERETRRRLDALATAVTQALEARIAVHVLPTGSRRAHERYGATRSCCYLIRPDGYVGFRAKPLAARALAAHLGRLFPSNPAIDPPIALQQQT